MKNCINHTSLTHFNDDRYSRWRMVVFGGIVQSLLPFNVHFYLITTGAPMQPAQRKEMRALKNVTVYETEFLLEWMERPGKALMRPVAGYCNWQKNCSLT